MTENTLKITFKQAQEHRNAARERLHRAEMGETSGEFEQNVRFVLNLEEFDDIDRLMRSSNLRLIEAIVSERPASMRQLADIVDRDYREVHRNLEELESLGVIEFENDGNRKRPQLRQGTDNIDFSFRFPRSIEPGETSGASV